MNCCDRVPVPLSHRNEPQTGCPAAVLGMQVYDGDISVVRIRSAAPALERVCVVKVGLAVTNDVDH